MTLPAVDHRFSQLLVVGGGISGLTCARTLADTGRSVRVLDKGRQAGGRVSTRRIGDQAFDHGAQYFTVRDARFRDRVDGWRREGVVASWRGRIGTLENGRLGPARGTTERYVGVPGMSALGRRLAAGLDVRTGTRVEALAYDGAAWRARCADGSEFAAAVAVLALPAPQAVALLPGGTEIGERVAAVRMSPCWAVLATFPRPVALDLDGAFVADSPLAWVARNGSKPHRPAAESWVLHASPEWSAEHLEADGEEVSRELLDAFAAAAGVRLPRAEKAVAHRWRYSTASRPLGEDFLYHPDSGLGVCGDWCPGSRIEGAFLSGLGLAEALLHQAAPRGEPGRLADLETGFQ